jgi:hypothetical protein
VFSFFVPGSLGFFNIFFGAYLFNEYHFGRRGELQAFGGPGHHALGGADKKYFPDFPGFYRFYHFVAVQGIVEEGGSDGAHVDLFPFGGFPGNDAVALYEQAVVDDVFDVVIFGNEFGPEAFTGAAFSHQCVDFCSADQLPQPVFHSGPAPGGIIKLCH